MSLNNGSDRGFTLIEVLVATVLLGIAISTLIGGLAQFTNLYRMSLEREGMVRIADEKLDELIGTGEWESVTEGSFVGDRYADYTWSLETETTTIEGLELVRLTVTKGGDGREDTQTAETLVYRPATTTVPLGGP